MAATGLRQRHGLNCQGGRCDCPWEAGVYSKADAKKLRKTFAMRALALEWQERGKPKVRQGAMRAPTVQTLREASEAWLEGARSGLIRTRSGDPYKPSAVRSYEGALRLRVLPALGSNRLGDVTRTDVQDLADKMLAEGFNPSTIGVTMLPLRAIYRRAIRRPETGITVNPTSGLELPKVRGGRDRIATPEECAKLLAVLPAADRPIWATAMYGGLRSGGLMGLRIEDVDLGSGVIHVRRGWDAIAGEIETKARNERRVPIAAVLRDYLDEHLLTLPWREGLIFGRSALSAFPDSSLQHRADGAWEGARLERITLHECRHTFASLMIAAGVNAKALSTYMGHANIAITYDRYGHLMPGNEGEAAGLLDAYLARADTGARLAQLDTTGADSGASDAETAS